MIMVKTIPKFLVGILLVLALFSVVSACGPIDPCDPCDPLMDIVVHSPENGGVYELNEELPFSISVVSAASVQVKAIAKITYPDDSQTKLILYQNGVNHENVFTPTMVGEYKVVFYAEDYVGNSASETVIFTVKETITPPTNELEITINSPELDSEYEVGDSVLFSAEVTSTNDVQIKVRVYLKHENGTETWFNLETLDEVHFEATIDNLEEGKYKAVFYAKDFFGNEASAETKFAVVEEEDDDNGSGDDEDEGKYYMCTFWTDWSKCVKNYKTRICLEQERTDFGDSFESLIGFKDYERCTSPIQITGDSIKEDSKKAFNLYWLIVIALAILIILLAILIGKRIKE